MRACTRTKQDGRRTNTAHTHARTRTKTQMHASTTCSRTQMQAGTHALAPYVRTRGHTIATIATITIHPPKPTRPRPCASPMGMPQRNVRLHPITGDGHTPKPNIVEPTHLSVTSAPLPPHTARNAPEITATASYPCHAAMSSARCINFLPNVKGGWLLPAAKNSTRSRTVSLHHTRSPHTANEGPGGLSKVTQTVLHTCRNLGAVSGHGARPPSPLIGHRHVTLG